MKAKFAFNMAPIVGSKSHQALIPCLVNIIQEDAFKEQPQNNTGAFAVAHTSTVTVTLVPQTLVQRQHRRRLAIYAPPCP
jgi:hypothetical protein